MCMSNLNAIVDVEALNANKEIVTKYNDNSAYKIVPVDKNNKVTKLLITFSASIINGKDNFFLESKVLYFQLRLTSKSDKANNSLIIKNFEIDFENIQNYFTCDYADFIVDNRNFILDIDLSNLNIDTFNFLAVLVKTKNEMDSDKPWTIQSVTPIKFQENG